MDLMTERQWKRWEVVQRVLAGAVTAVAGAAALGVSTRHIRRMIRRVEADGRAGLLHGNKGRRPANRVTDEVRGQILELRRNRYAGFNDVHLTEKLGGSEQIQVSRSTVRAVLREAGEAAVRKRRAPRHRRRRDRKRQAGQMVLWDGSRHDWLEGRGPVLCLMGAIDDATGELLPGARFMEQECAAGYLGVLKTMVEEKGIPWSVYQDRHGSLHRNDDHWTLEEQLRGEQDPTHVGAALKALEVEQIYALSPQAKGRVERLWRTLQDRLVSELRLAGVSTVSEAGAVLERYRLEHNTRFAIPAAATSPAWRPVRPGVDVTRICSFRYDTDVRNDNTARVAGHVIDIPPGAHGRSWTRVRVEVRQLLDGRWRVYAKDKLIAEGPPSSVGELRALPRRKRSAAERAFRASIIRVANALP